MEDKNSIKREVILILIGALISAFTAIITTTLNNIREDKKANIQKKLELNDQISKDLGERLYYTYMVYRRSRDNDKQYKEALMLYTKSKQEWNIKIYSYQSLLKHYYSDKVKNEFVKNIFVPLVELGKEAEYKTFDKNFPKKWCDQQSKNINFVSTIYDLTEK